MPEKLLLFWPSHMNFKACMNLWTVFHILTPYAPSNVKLSTAKSAIKFRLEYL